MLKVLHITESNGFSGGVNQALYLARLIKDKGVDNFFASPNPSILREKAKDEFSFFDFKPEGNLDFKTILKLKKIFETKKFDIVHSHHPKAHNYSFWAKKLSKYKPVLVVSRRVSHPIPTNLLAKIRYLSKEVNKYIAVSKSVEEILINYGIEKDKIAVIYSGVDTKRFNKKEKDLEFKKSLGFKDDDFIISHIGNFSNEKGQFFTIMASKILIDKGYKFKIIFAGMKTDKNEIKELFNKSDIPIDYGIFLGFRDDVERILNITDISVNSSIKGEALSGSMRESLASGVAVVASDISGNREIVKDGENGFLFRPGNYFELAQKLEILINNKEMREKFSKNAVDTIEEKFTVNRMAENTLNLYRELINKKHIMAL
jgi:glycosyltransferase involved in cell wall biosynthesis